MPPTVQTKGLRVAVPPLCFCGRLVHNRETYYCSPECAREDAFKSLTLGKPHESKSKFAPLPTLPPGFFDLPPKRGGHASTILSLDNDDDLYDFTSRSFTGKTMTDHGPFQTAPRPRPRSRARENPATSDPPVPRSITSSISSTGTTPIKRSKWQSHYQREQGRDSIDDSSMDVPFFLVDEAEENLLDVQELEGPAVDESKLLSPSSAIATTPTLSTSLHRTGSFGPLTGELPPFTCKEGMPLLRQRSNTASSYGNSINHPRSSSSSYNSLMTGVASQSSYTSPDVSPTKSDYAVPPTETVIARPKYGSAFGGSEENSVSGPVVQLSIDVTESTLANRRRRKSSDESTPRAEQPPESVQQEDQPPPQVAKPDETPLANMATTPSIDSAGPTATPVQKSIPPSTRTRGVTTVSKSQWPQFGLPSSRVGTPCLPIAPTPSIPWSTSLTGPLPVYNPEIESPQPRAVAGTVVKKTMMTSKTRLPIGSTPSTSHPPIPRPKTPSNTPSSGLSVSLHANTFRAPAYAMGTLKISASTRTLRTSASQSSLKSKKEVPLVHIPGVQNEEEEVLPEKVPVVTQVQRQDIEKAEDEPVVPIKKERDSIKSTLAGSYFKLYGTPKSRRETQQVESVPTPPPLPEKGSKTSRLTLKLDSYSFNALWGKSDSTDATPKPSPSVSKYSLNGNEKSPTTPTGPLTPCVEAEGNPTIVMTSPTDTTTPFLRSISPLQSSREIGIRSPSFSLNPPRAKNGGVNPSDQTALADLSGSSSMEEMATVHVAKKLRLSAAPSAIRSSLWDARFKR
ncbi:hypothetical protein FRC17_002444 [Serendipita sp. 399]|nr:hypothetical protein FRC17_002444 [Serendipita sp. 399]